MKETVVVNEVGARDGLQNQARVLSVAQRVELIRALADAGLRHIEVGSFVSPKAVPCMLRLGSSGAARRTRSESASSTSTAMAAESGMWVWR